MSSSKKETAWSRLPDPSTVEPSLSYVANAVALSDTEFTLSTRVFNKIKILKYNSLKNEWTKWSEMDSYNGPNHFPFDKHFFSMDKTRNKLFLFEGEGDLNYYAIMMNDLAHKRHNEWTKLSEACSFSVEWYQRHNAYPAHSGTVFVNGVCHLFVVFREMDSDLPKLQHYMLDEDAKAFVDLFEIDMDFLGGFSIFPIYVSKLNSILLIHKHGELWRFKLDANEWNKVKVQGVPIPIELKMATITSDEQRIVMANRKNILLLDISDENDFKLLKSDIGIPVHSKARSSRDVESMIRTGSTVMNEKLVIGWTKRLFKKKHFHTLHLPPLYLLQMIALWVLSEEIHYLRRQYDNNESKWGSQEHFVIRMKRILASKLTTFERQDLSPSF